MQVATITVGPFTLPVPCYLIQIRDGKNILIDSGYFHTEQTEEVKEDALGHRLIITLGKDVFEQLATIGVRPADIDLLICSHPWSSLGMTAHNGQRSNNSRIFSTNCSFSIQSGSSDMARQTGH